MRTMNIRKQARFTRVTDSESNIQEIGSIDRKFSIVAKGTGGVRRERERERERKRDREWPPSCP